MGVSMLISGVVSLLIPPPSMPRLSAGDGAGQQLPVFSITGSRNQANLYGPIPLILGHQRVFPPHGARPYTELVGNDQYLRCLFVSGRGKSAIRNLKTGEPPIEESGEIEYETRDGAPSNPPLTLFTNTVFEEAPGGGSSGIALMDGTAHTRR